MSRTWINLLDCCSFNEMRLPLTAGALSDVRVFLLLSTHNGAAYLQAQLDSLVAQTHANWVLFWRDDCSSDETIELLARFTLVVGVDRCIRVTEPEGRLFPAASFVAVLRAAVPVMGPTDVAAFVDQDDVWLSDKLARGATALLGAYAEVPMLYCARLIVVDASLTRITETTLPTRRCGFPASLAQNVATGCTIMMNSVAASLVAASEPPNASPHDWWCYLLITAAGGRVLMDGAAVALYRQHGGNFIGMPPSNPRRAMAALRRGPQLFMNVLRQHLAALSGQLDSLSDPARTIVIQLQVALQGDLRQKLKVLRLPGLHRQSWLETLLFRLWFLIG